MTRKIHYAFSSTNPKTAEVKTPCGEEIWRNEIKDFITLELKDVTCGLCLDFLKRPDRVDKSQRPKKEVQWDERLDDFYKPLKPDLVKSAAFNEWIEHLTKQQRQILEFRLDGMTQDNIAKELKVSQQAISNQLKFMWKKFSKFRCCKRAE